MPNALDRDRGCDYCADDDNMLYGHVEQIASSDERRALLLRCPHCRSMYEVRPGEVVITTRLSENEASERFPA